jgi:hypothetical protein
MSILFVLTIALFACNIRGSEYNLNIVYTPQRLVDPYLVNLSHYRPEQALWAPGS